MRNVLDKVAAKINTHFLCCSVTFFSETCHLWGNMENYIEPHRWEITI